MSRLFVFLGLCSIFSCRPKEPPATGSGTAVEEKLFKQVFEAHACRQLDRAQVAFTFRNRRYIAIRRGGLFQYERQFLNEQGDTVRDILANEGFRRLIQGREVELSPKDSSAYANSVNSVIYFALLPCFLQDPAVQAVYLGEAQVEDEPYHKVRVTFRQEGGGKDYEDTFAYWFHRDRHTLDYLAYNYLTDGGGARFREAFNIREVGGIRFADYINYKPRTDRRDVAEFDRLFEQGELEELSRIELTNIQVVPIHED